MASGCARYDSDADDLDLFAIDMDGNSVLRSPPVQDAPEYSGVVSEQARIYILHTDLHSPDALAGQNAKILSITDVNHLFVGSMRNQIRKLLIDGRTAVLRPEMGISGIAGHVWVDPTLEGMFRELCASFVLRVSFPDHTLRDVSMAWRLRADGKTMEFTTVPDVEIVVVSNRKADRLGLILHMAINGVVQDMILASAEIPVGSLCSELSMDYATIRRESMCTDDDEDYFAQLLFPPQAHPPMDVREVARAPSPEPSQQTVKMHIGRDGREWRPLTDGAADMPEARIAYKVSVAFDPTVKEQQEDELERIRIKLRHRSRTATQPSASRLMQRTTNFTVGTDAELAHDAFVVYSHRRLHNPHAFRNADIPHDLAYDFMTLPKWVDAYQTKKSRKQKEQMDMLEEAMTALSDAGDIYRNALVHTVVLVCPRDVIMSRVGIVLDMHVPVQSPSTSARAKEYVRPAPRHHLPEDEGTSMSCISCVTPTAFIGK